MDITLIYNQSKIEEEAKLLKALWFFSPIYIDYVPGNRHKQN